jgi:hypothetical protein
MILEKDKIYKVKHLNVHFRRRNYIIFSPLENIVLNGEIDDMIPMTFRTHFTICFDGSIITKNDVNAKGDSNASSTGMDKSCSMARLTNADYDDIRRALIKLGNNCHYNRKLNKIVYGI